MFWKGWGSVCICKGATILTKVGACELLHVARYESTSNFKYIIGNFFSYEGINLEKWRQSWHVYLIMFIFVGKLPCFTESSWSLLL